MRRLFVAVCACGLAAGRAPAAPPPDVSALVEQLGADRYADREAAEAALEKIGAPAAAALASAAARSSSPEVRQRAAAVLGRVRRAADSAARLTPKRVALDYHSTPLGTAVNDLKARTGLNLTLDPDRVANPLRTVTCRTAEVPVWEAVEAFCAAAGLREEFRAELAVAKPPARPRGYVPPPPAPLPDAVPVVLVDGKPARLPGARATAVRVLALPASFPGHRVTLGTGEVALCLDVTPAPGLGWQEAAGVKVIRVTDAAGRAGRAGTEKDVPAWDPNGMPGWGGARRFFNPRFDHNGNPVPPDAQPNPRVVPVHLKLADPEARALRRLEGSVFGEVLVPDQTLIAVDDPRGRTNNGFAGPGDLRLTVLEVAAAKGPGALGTVRAQLEFPSPYALNLRRRGWNPGLGWPEAPPRPGSGNKVVAYDAAGNPFPVTGTNLLDMSDDGMTMVQVHTLSFRHGSGVPARLAVVGPKAVAVEVPFVLEDVPLP